MKEIKTKFHNHSIEEEKEEHKQIGRHCFEIRINCTLNYFHDVRMKDSYKLKLLVLERSEWIEKKKATEKINAFFHVAKRI